MAYLGTKPANAVLTSEQIGDGVITSADISSGVTINFADGSASSPSITNDGDTNTGIFFPAADTIAFAEGGAEVARFDSSGKLLVGASSATGQAGGAVQAYLATQGVDTAGTIFAAATDSFAADKGGQVMMGGKYRALGDYCSFGGLAAKKENGTDGNYAGYLQFLVSNNPSGNLERMRINSSGDLLIGTTSVVSVAAVTVSRFETVNSTNNGSWSAGVIASGASNNRGLAVGYSVATPNDAFNEAIFFADATATRFVVASNGGIKNFSANNVNLSDERTKKDIELAGNYLDKICAIPVKTFLYKDQTDTDLNLGVIAQDVEAVAPELVNNDGFGETPEDGVPLKTIYQTDLQYALMKCIQEQQAIITELKTRIEALEQA
jgi:hypothetical protein